MYRNVPVMVMIAVVKNNQWRSYAEPAHQCLFRHFLFSLKNMWRKQKVWHKWSKTHTIVLVATFREEEAMWNMQRLQDQRLWALQALPGYEKAWWAWKNQAMLHYSKMFKYGKHWHTNQVQCALLLVHGTIAQVGILLKILKITQWFAYE